MNGLTNIYSDKTKKFLLYLTVGLLSFCAFVGIIAVFVGDSTALWQVASTALIIYLMTLFSSANIERLNGENKGVMICAIIALISNVFWGIPWILLVWGVFGGLSFDTIIDVWRVIWTFALVSIYCTVLARNIPKIKHASSAILKLYSSISTVFATFICTNLLLLIWEVFSDFELLYKFMFAELILVLLQFVVSKILLHNQQQDENNPVSSTQVMENHQITNPNAEATKPVETKPNNQTNEDALRAQIEKEVRAKIAAEQNMNEEAKVIVYQEETEVVEATGDNADQPASEPTPEAQS